MFSFTFDLKKIKSDCKFIYIYIQYYSGYYIKVRANQWKHVIEIYKLTYFVNISPI